MKTNLFTLTLTAVCLCGQVFSQFNILDESTIDDPLNYEHVEEPIDISAFDGSLFEILDQVFDSVRHDPVITGMTAALMTPEGEIWTRAGGWAATLPENDSLRTDHLMGIAQYYQDPLFLQRSFPCIRTDFLILMILISDYMWALIHTYQSGPGFAICFVIVQV